MDAPFLFKPGMMVVPGLWYTDGQCVRQCVIGGNPTAFGEPYFKEGKG